MQQPHQQPRTDLIASLKKYGQHVRQKLEELSLWRPKWLLLNLPDRVKHKVDRQPGRKLHTDSSDAAYPRKSLSVRSDGQSAPSVRRLSVHLSHRVLNSSRTSIVDTLVELPVSNVPMSNISPEHLDFDEHISSGFDILLRLPGDNPEQNRPAVASIDTQLVEVNLMRREIWETRLNEDGRGHLELDHNAYVTTIKSDRIPIIGVARGVEWHFKNGPRTYTSDFHIIEMGDFDVLIGSDTIKQYRLVVLGPDVRYHLRKTNANKRESVQAGETVSITRAQGLNAFGRVTENLLSPDLHNVNDSLVDEVKTPIPATRATITTSASNPKGYGHNIKLRAIIDETIEENLISRNRLKQIQDSLSVSAMPLGSAKALQDSCNMSYEAQSKVCLLVRPCDGTRTEAFWFYIAETDTALVADGHDIILAKSWKTKFPIDAQDGVKTYRAAPTVYRKGDDGEEWKKNSSEKSKKNLEEAAAFEAQWEKDGKEQKKWKGPSNGQ
ncbi:retropepsin-like aspartic protease [Aspergillus foveolatus]|uniref:retropepsin-like aspartic protease n=1 Tax=Aspergillus foveolatus TaxID=210207 RepID=UPI003CCDC9AE